MVERPEELDDLLTYVEANANWTDEELAMVEAYVKDRDARAQSGRPKGGTDA